MKKNQGFTLIELLAVIVILAVIALITTPVILGVIDKAKKGALQDSAYGLIDSANIYYAEKMLENNNEKLDFTFSDGVQTSVNKLNYKGKVENGSLKLFKDSKTAVCITEGKYAAIKNINDEKVIIKTGRCEYNEETNEYETKELCQDLQNETDKLKRDHKTELDRLKKEYDEKVLKLTEDQLKELENIRTDYEAQLKTLTDAYELQLKTLNDQIKEKDTIITNLNSEITTGKTALANSITNKGVATTENDSFTAMAGNVDSINTGGYVALFYGTGSVTTTPAAAGISYNNPELSTKSENSLIISKPGTYRIIGTVSHTVSDNTSHIYTVVNGKDAAAAASNYIIFRISNYSFTLKEGQSITISARLTSDGNFPSQRRGGTLVVVKES